MHDAKHDLYNICLVFKDFIAFAALVFKLILWEAQFQPPSKGGQAWEKAIQEASQGCSQDGLDGKNGHVSTKTWALLWELNVGLCFLTAANEGLGRDPRT